MGDMGDTSRGREGTLDRASRTRGQQEDAGGAWPWVKGAVGDGAMGDGGVGDGGVGDGGVGDRGRG